ncbi:hypothetical protein NQZ68_011409 [Dissostichus eleginoides]|nr:hypothetical protein NQZ68_011409 [Dissostichus eleginoides]
MVLTESGDYHLRAASQWTAVRTRRRRRTEGRSPLSPTCRALNARREPTGDCYLKEREVV